MTLPELSLTSWAGLMAAAAVVGTCWRTIGVWVERLFTLIIGRAIIKDDAARAVMSHVWQKGLGSPLGCVCYGGVTTHVAPRQRVEIAAYEAVVSEPRLVWVGRAPVLVQCGMTSNQHDALNIGSQRGVSAPVIIRYLRGTLDVEAFIADAVQGYNALRQAATAVPDPSEPRRPKRFNVVRMHGPGGGEGRGGGLQLSNGAGAKGSVPSYGDDPEETVRQLQRNELRVLAPWTAADLIQRPVEGTKPFGSHPVAPEVLAQFSELGEWLKHERWFRDRGIPWRRGFLLAGKPGSGKDTLVRNLALLHDLPIYAFDLSSYDNQSFTGDWKTVMQNAPAIALISDIDAVFQGRVNVAVQGKQRDGLTFDHLLNTISGVQGSDGVLLFITTNHLESVDPALGIPASEGAGTKSTRPGRIDKVIRMGAMGEPERRILAAHILADYPDLIEATVLAGDGEMAAQFQERCAQLALERWNAGDRPAVVEAPALLAPPEDPVIARLDAMFADVDVGRILRS